MYKRYELPQKCRLPPERVGEALGPVVVESRLCIAGLVDIALQRKDLWVGPAPLLLVDGQYAFKPLDLNGKTRHYFWGPKEMLDAEDEVECLSRSSWAYQVEVPVDASAPATAHLGHGGYPDTAIARILEEPVPFRQADYDELVEAWRADPPLRLNW